MTLGGRRASSEHDLLGPKLPRIKQEYGFGAPGSGDAS
jgi:hypothetical protein